MLPIPEHLEKTTLNFISAQQELQSEINYHFVYNYLENQLPNFGFKFYDFKNCWEFKNENIEIIISNDKYEKEYCPTNIFLKWVEFSKIDNKRVGFCNGIKRPYFEFYYFLKQLNHLLIKIEAKK